MWRSGQEVNLAKLQMYLSKNLVPRDQGFNAFNTILAPGVGFEPTRPREATGF